MASQASTLELCMAEAVAFIEIVLPQDRVLQRATVDSRGLNQVAFEAQRQKDQALETRLTAIVVDNLPKDFSFARRTDPATRIMKRASLGPSAISHGGRFLGVFCNEPIKKGEQVLNYPGYVMSSPEFEAFPISTTTAITITHDRRELVLVGDAIELGPNVMCNYKNKSIKENCELVDTFASSSTKAVDVASSSRQHTRRGGGIFESVVDLAVERIYAPTAYGEQQKRYDRTKQAEEEVAKQSTRRAAFNKAVTLNESIRVTALSTDCVGLCALQDIGAGSELILKSYSSTFFRLEYEHNHCDACLVFYTSSSDDEYVQCSQCPIKCHMACASYPKAGTWVCQHCSRFLTKAQYSFKPGTADYILLRISALMQGVRTRDFMWLPFHLVRSIKGTKEWTNLLDVLRSTFHAELICTQNLFALDFNRQADDAEDASKTFVDSMDGTCKRFDSKRAGVDNLALRIVLSVRDTVLNKKERSPHKIKSLFCVHIKISSIVALFGARWYAQHKVHGYHLLAALARIAGAFDLHARCVEFEGDAQGIRVRLSSSSHREADHTVLNPSHFCTIECSETIKEAYTLIQS